MNLTSYLANKCFALLINSGLENEGRNGRSALSRSRPDTSPQEILPPWSAEDRDFLAQCDGCGQCAAACRENILIIDNNGRPQIDFSAGSCTFCGRCAESCKTGALSLEDPYSSPWTVQAFVTGDCLARNNVLCRTCAEHCDEYAIIFSKTNPIAAPEILPDRCTGCGACFSPCPVKAIEMRRNE
ncbi:MAG: ferredoxin-type protein NapF [Desulfobulbaceae bacterium]|nr:ferredoxin-type protein NapF [Desulfobulbaceae bacterium]